MDLVTMLKQNPEPLPDWLREPSSGFDRGSFFGSRTVYYPASGIDGHPVKICARAHAAHAFVYVDNGMSKQAIRDRIFNIRGVGFRGYPVEHEEEVEESVLHPRGWTQHDNRKGRSIARRLANIEPFRLYVVLRRDEDHDNSHGPERLAVLFVGGDGFDWYDALYRQNADSRPPYLVVIQDCSFAGIRGRFGAGGLLERIACGCDAHPKFLLVGATPGQGRHEPWSGYTNTGATPELGGVQCTPRLLFRREEASGTRELKTGP